MEAARAELVATALKPALAAGRVVLCDRYADSTLAYQGAGRGLDLAMLHEWNRVATGGLDPDLTLLYDLDPAIGLERRAGDHGVPNRLDRESLEFHARVRACFLELARAEPGRFVVIDAGAAPAAVERRTWEAVEGRLAGAGTRAAGSAGAARGAVPCAIVAAAATVWPFPDIRGSAPARWRSGPTRRDS